MKDDNGKKSLAEVISGNIKLIIVIIGLITALITFFVAYSELGGAPVQPPTPTPAITLPVPAIAETPKPTLPQTTTQTSTPTPTRTPTPTPTLTPTEGIDQFQIDWGTLEVYFDISDVTIGETQTTDVLGMVSEYDSINFIVEAKRSFDAIILFEATFYDDKGIEIYSSFIYFDPDYNRWEPGVKAVGYMLLPSTHNIEKIQFIEISQFIY